MNSANAVERWGYLTHHSAAFCLSGTYIGSHITVIIAAAIVITTVNNQFIQGVNMIGNFVYLMIIGFFWSLAVAKVVTDRWNGKPVLYLDVALALFATAMFAIVLAAGTKG